jgi:hypothetical protein
MSIVVEVAAPVHGPCTDAIRCDGAWMTEHDHGTTAITVGGYGMDPADFIGKDHFAIRAMIRRHEDAAMRNAPRMSSSQDLAYRRAQYQAKSRRLGLR